MDLNARSLFLSLPHTHGQHLNKYINFQHKNNPLLPWYAQLFFGSRNCNYFKHSVLWFTQQETENYSNSAVNYFNRLRSFFMTCHVYHSGQFFQHFARDFQQFAYVWYICSHKVMAFFICVVSSLFLFLFLFLSLSLSHFSRNGLDDNGFLNICRTT